MTAPTCGARTWAAPGELVACYLRGAHDEHEALCFDGSHSWTDAAVQIDGHGLAFVEVISPDAARALIASLQRQLDALDPDAAIAEAERAWLAALERAATLDAMLSEVRDVEASSPFARRRDALLAAVKRADAHAEQAEAAWLALVEARDAKGGGA